MSTNDVFSKIISDFVEVFYLSPLVRLYERVAEVLVGCKLQGSNAKLFTFGSGVDCFA